MIKRCAIVIVSWNVASYLERCLLSIARHCQQTEYVIIVVDNASTDSTAEVVRRLQRTTLKGRLRLIANSHNHGFATAVNQGVQRLERLGWSDAPILLLNPDVEIHSNIFSPLLKEFDAHDEVGVIGPTLFDEDGIIQRSVMRLPGVWSSLLTLLKLHHVLYFLPVLRRYFAMDMDYTVAQSVEQVQGAFFLIRRECWDALNGMDSHYFIWFEEVDFCARALTNGWSVRYVPSAGIIHHGGKSFIQEKRLLKQQYYQRSLCWYMAKHKGFWSWLLFWLLQPVGLMLSAITSIFPPARRIWVVNE